MKTIKKFLKSETAAEIGAGAVATLIFAWIFFLLGIMTNEEGIWKDGLNGILIGAGGLAIGFFCIGCGWLAYHKNIILRVIGNVLCFILLSAFFVGCCAWVSLLGRH